MNDNNKFRILVIDDNPSIHNDFIKILKTTSFTELDHLSKDLFGAEKEIPKLPEFEIDTASQGQEGVEKVKKAFESGKPYALAFVDVRMPPGWDGIVTIQHIWEIDKTIQIVICTAYSDYTWEETVTTLGNTDNLLVLKKPFDNISVRQLASALTAKWQLAKKTRDYTRLLKEQVADRTLSLENSLSLIKSTFESSSDAIIIINNAGRIIDYNNKIVDMLEIPQSLLEEKDEGKFYIFLNSKLENNEGFIKKSQELHSHPEEISIDVIKFKNGKIFECYSQPHKLNDEIIGRILDFRDITQRAKLEQELKYQATHDSLTGLANRITLHNQIKLAISKSQQQHTQFAVLFLDFDRFKLINDSLSHSVGDVLLKDAADRLKTLVGPENTLARIGGDEFVIILSDIGKEDKSVDNQVNQIVANFRKPFNVANREVTLTASIGISSYPKDGHTADILLRNADAAMYRAKAKKGNNYEFFSSEMNSETLALLDQEMELRQAIANEEFYLVYQPQIDLAKNKLVAVEALLRWQHPSKGILLPMDFVPLAQDTGLVIPIGEWVMYTACKQNKAWQDAGFPKIRVAVNVTAEQLIQYDLIDKVKNILEKTQLPPEYLEIELTENVILSNPAIIKVVKGLKKLGVFIAVDDFGTGYSSLSYLKKIPLDRLKIDSSFLHNVQSSTDDEVIFRAILAMAKNLNLEVLAEGVETEAQLDFLKQNSCADVQGFYFSKPLKTKDLEKYFKSPKQFENSNPDISSTKEE